MLKTSLEYGEAQLAEKREAEGAKQAAETQLCFALLRGATPIIMSEPPKCLRHLVVPLPILLCRIGQQVASRERNQQTDDSNDAGV